MTSLLLNIEANSASLKQELSSAKSSINNFTNNLSKVAGAIGVAFSVQEVLQFGLEVSKLAAEFQGVETAFKKLDGSTELMLNLKKATNGTVSELSLMKRAVQFSNFGLDVEQLPKLLEFASKRAVEVGGSVDAMAESIVLGISRKSIPILDNLGISASQVNEEFEKTGDFVKAVGNIVDKELGRMGDAIETNVTKTARLAASWENYKVKIGQASNETGILGSVLDTVSDNLDVLASDNIPFYMKALNIMTNGSVTAQLKQLDELETMRKAGEERKKQAQIINEVNRYYKEFNGNIEAYAKAISTHVYKTELLAEFQKRLNAEEEKRQAGIENIANLTARLNSLSEQQQTLTGQQLAQTNREIALIEQKIEALKNLGFEQSKQQTLFNPSQTKISGGADLGVNTSIDPNALLQNVDFDGVTNQVLGIASAWDGVGESMRFALAETGTEAISTFGAALVGMTTEQDGAFKSLVGSMLGGIQKIINGLLAQAIAAAIAGEASKGLLGLAFAAVAIGGIMALWSKIPAFEHGGNYKGGLALVGEAGPELINFNSGGRVYNHNQTKDILSGSKFGRLEAIVTGEQIRFVLNETERRRS